MSYDPLAVHCDYAEADEILDGFRRDYPSDLEFIAAALDAAYGAGWNVGIGAVGIWGVVAVTEIESPTPADLRHEQRELRFRLDKIREWPTEAAILERLADIDYLLYGSR